jgi:hypothetical protein
MVVTSFKEIHDGRDGGGEILRDGSVRRHTRVFRAITDSNTDDDVTVLASAPALGAIHPTDMAAYLQRRRARNESFSKRVWIVSLGYSTEREREEDPLADPIQIEWSTEQFRTPVWKDINDKGIVNSAGDPFDPPAEKDDSRLTATVRVNLVAVPPWILGYQDAVNESEFTVDGVSIPKGVAKMQSVRVSPWQERNDVRYRAVTMLLHFREPLEGDDAGKEWHLWLLDQGFREKEWQSPGSPIENAKMQNIGNSGDGQPPSMPVPLNGKGVALEQPTVDNTVFLDFEVYKKKDFSILPFR